MASSLTNSSHLDSASIFCPNPGVSTLENFPAGAAIEPKQEFFNTYNNEMQQYTSSFYPSYPTTAYPARSSKISSADNYLASSYASIANNGVTQLYSNYGYNNFNQFGGAQHEYPAYYNDQYAGYYNTPGYPSYTNSSSSSGAQNFHVSSELNESPLEIQSPAPTIVQHSSHSSLSIPPNAHLAVSNKSSPETKKARGRRHANSSPTRSITSENGQISDNYKGPDRVFIWDLDETIIIFHSLITGSFANRFSKDPIRMNYMASLATSMEELIFNMADQHFFFNDIENCDQVHIDDVSSDDNGQDLTNYDFRTDGFHANTTPNIPNNLCLSTGVRGSADWMRKLAFRYRKIKDMYNTYKNKCVHLLYFEQKCVNV